MPAPPNNICSGAINIGTAFPITVSVNPADAASDPSNPSTPCGSSQSFGAMYYKITIPGGVSRLGITTDGVSGAQAIIVFFSGSCGSLVPLGCTNSGGGGELLVPVVAGQTYYLLSSNGTATHGHRNVFVRDATTIPNDDCAGAIDLGPTLPASVTIDTRNADADVVPDSGCGSGVSHHSVWYKSVIPAGVTRIGVKVTDSGNLGVVTILATSCAGISVGCSSSPTEVLITVIPGVTYYYMVTSDTNTGITATLTIRDATLPAPGSNTFCLTIQCGTPMQWFVHRFDAKIQKGQTG